MDVVGIAIGELVEILGRVKDLPRSKKLENSISKKIRALKLYKYDGEAKNVGLLVKEAKKEYEAYVESEKDREAERR